MKHTSIIICFLVTLFSSLSFAQISNIDFVNANYEFGLQPTNILSNDVYDAYVSWRNTFPETCGNGRYRIRFDNPSETVSEGIAYGMLLSVYANDKELFDGLWLYYQDFLNSNGVMNWKINGCNSVLGFNGATDAELDAAYALIVADKRWGNAGTVNYQSDALSLIDIIKNHEVENGTFVLKPGDAFGGSNLTNPSYLSPGYFRTFGIYSNDSTFWNAVADKSYEIINSNLTQNGAVFNLVSDWCSADGSYSNNASGFYNQGQSYFYDAARTPWRIAVDYIWYNNADALSYLNLCNNFVNAQGGFDEIYPGYSQTGVAITTSYKDPAFTGAYASAAMSSTSQNFVDTGYTVLKGQPTGAYFGATLRVMYMFTATGNMYNALAQNVLSNPETSTNSFKIYPNPVSDVINISLGNQNTGDKIIELYTLSGQKVLDKKVSDLNTQLNIQGLNEGIYFLKINDTTFKIVKSL